MSETLLDALRLLGSFDANGEATGTLYEDAGDGMEYMLGEYLMTTFKASRDGDEVKVEVADQKGKMKAPDRVIKVRVIQ